MNIKEQIDLLESSVVEMQRDYDIAIATSNRTGFSARVSFVHPFPVKDLIIAIRHYLKLLKDLDDGKVRIVPTEPTHKHLTSMAFRYDHSFGIDRDNNFPFPCGHTADSRRAILTTMRQLYEEVVTPSHIAESPDYSWYE